LGNRGHIGKVVKELVAEAFVISRRNNDLDLIFGVNAGPWRCLNKHDSTDESNLFAFEQF
jgi:hypothetical protein